MKEIQMQSQLTEISAVFATAGTDFESQSTGL
jgi:hypothetical protein